MPASETILEPSSAIPVAVSAGQLVRLIPSASTRLWFRTNRAASGDAWTEITSGTAVTEVVWPAPTTVTRRFTFDRVQVIALATPPSGDYTGGLAFNLVEGPVVGLFVTPSVGNEALEAPPLDPNADESDDPSLGAPLLMAGANRDGLATTPLESSGGLRGGPLSLAASWSSGVFVDTSGRAGVRTPFMTDVRGLGPFPAIAAYHHEGLYFHHDHGAGNSLALTRVLYEGPDGDVAIVRGDGRRSTYRHVSESTGLHTYQAAATSSSTLSGYEGWGRQAWGLTAWGGGQSWVETTSSGRQFLFGQGGRLRRVVDRYGSAVYYTYDANDRLQKIAGPAGSQGLVPYLSYDANGLLERLVLEDPVTAANNRTAYFEYSPARLLTRIVGPELCRTYFFYDGSQKLSGIEDPDGHAWRLGYAGDRVDRVADASVSGATTYFAYDLDAGVTTRKDRAGKVTYLHFNAFGSPTRVYDLLTPADYFAYDTDEGRGGPGNLRASTNRLGNTWTYEYDSRGNRISSTDPLAARSYFAYDAQDLLRHHVDPIDRTTYLAYDGSRNRTQTIDPIGNTAYFEYEPTGLLRYKKDRRGAFTYFVWDARATLSKVNDPLGHTTYFAYNSANETTAQVDPLGRTTYLEHDKRGRVVKQTNPIGAATYFAFDSRCNLVSQTDALLRSTLHEYDGNSNRTRSVDALGNAAYFTYDAEERLASQVNARLFPTTFSYDVLGRRQKTTDALGFETYLAYDAAHELERQIDARGNAVYFRYDAAGRLSHQRVHALEAETYFGYDLAGQRVKAIDARDKTTLFEHDPRGWQRRTQSAIGAVTYVAFDEEGNRLRSVDPLGKTAYFVYDLAGRLTHAKDASTPQGVTYTGYDRASQTVLRLDELFVPTYMAYDAAGRTQITQTPAGLITYSAYDLVGNLSFTNLDEPGRDRATTYHTYDAINRRLTTIDAHGAVTSMAYDRVGNVELTVDARGFGTYFTYDALNRRTHSKDGVHFALTYTGYDEVGNVVRQVDQQGATTYLTYDRVNRVQFSHDPAGALTYHAFDFVGNRTESHVLLGAAGERRSTYMQYDDVNRTVKRLAADGGETYFEYDLAGNQVRVVDPVGRPTYLTYDELNRQSTRKNALLETWTTVYDARSSVLRQRDPEGRTAYMGYDPARRLLHQSNALGESSYFFYDARGARTHVLNPRGHSTYMRYDLLGRQTHTIDALGGVSYMGYDATGNRTLAQDELGHATYFFFDGLSRTTRVMDATLKSTYMDYDSRSSLVERIDADGRGTYMGYDVASRLERTFFTNPKAGEVTDAPMYYGYDQVSNRIYTDDRLQGLGLTYFVFDKLDRTTVKRTMAGAVYYAFDKSGMKQELKDADEHLNYHVYDAAGRLDRLVLDGGRTAYYHHDLSGMVLKKLLPDNRVMSYFAYDVAGRLTQLTHCDDTGATIAYFAYQRNASGTPVWIRRDGGLNQYYEYDALNRLTLDQLKNASTQVYGFRYYYDLAGNRVRKDDDVAVRATYYTRDALNQLTKEWNFHTGATNYFDYDLGRRMTTQRSTTEARYFVYDQGARPTQIRHAAASPDAIHYFSYNGAGERVRVVEGSTEAYWSYDGSKLIRERRADDGFDTFRVYRHNESTADPVSGTVLETEKLGFVKQSPAQSPPCGKTTAMAGEVDGIPVIVYYQYDAFGVRQGVSSTMGGADTSQRTQFGGNGLLRLGTGPSIYLTKKGAYLAEQNMSVGSTKARNGDPAPFVPEEDGGSGDSDDPRDEPPPICNGEDIDFSVCQAGEPKAHYQGETFTALDGPFQGKPFSDVVQTTNTWAVNSPAYGYPLIPADVNSVGLFLRPEQLGGGDLARMPRGGLGYPNWHAKFLFFLEFPVSDTRHCQLEVSEAGTQQLTLFNQPPGAPEDYGPAILARNAAVRGTGTYKGPRRLFKEAFIVVDPVGIKGLQLNAKFVQNMGMRATVRSRPFFRSLFAGAALWTMEVEVAIQMDSTRPGSIVHLAPPSFRPIPGPGSAL